MQGKADISFNEITVPASMLSEISTNIEPRIYSKETLGGTFKAPGGAFDTIEGKFTLFIPDMDYMQYIAPEYYHSPVAPQTTGNVVYNSDSCVETTPGPVNIHWTCDDNDNDDVHFFNAYIVFNFNMTINTKDVVSIECTILANPDSNGDVFRLGTGDLTQDSIYDPTTETTIPVTS